jgi:hypothetical protein
MKIPPNVKTYDMSTSTIWFDEDGILYSLPKDIPEEPFSVENTLKEMEAFRKITGNKKVCMILESNKNSKPPAKEHRDLIAKELDSVTKAMAIVTNSPLSRMVANLFFGLKPPAYPAKMFSNEEEAKEWILQFCDKKS